MTIKRVVLLIVTGLPIGWLITLLFADGFEWEYMFFLCSFLYCWLFAIFAPDI